MESFLKRWARLKQQKNQTSSEFMPGTSLSSQSLSPPPLQPSALEKRDPPQTVPTLSSESLLTTDSGLNREDLFYSDKINALKADDDFAVFLQEDVPENIQKEALSFAWRTDDTIANFETLAEYDWNFNTPDYAKLQPTDNIKTLLADILSPPTPTLSSKEGLDAPDKGSAPKSYDPPTSLSSSPFSEGELEEKPEVPSDKNLKNQSAT